VLLKLRTDYTTIFSRFCRTVKRPFLIKHYMFSEEMAVCHPRKGCAYVELFDSCYVCSTHLRIHVCVDKCEYSTECVENNTCLATGLTSMRDFVADEFDCKDVEVSEDHADVSEECADVSGENEDAPEDKPEERVPRETEEHAVYPCGQQETTEHILHRCDSTTSSLHASSGCYGSTVRERLIIKETEARAKACSKRKRFQTDMAMCFLDKLSHSHTRRKMDSDHVEKRREEFEKHMHRYTSVTRMNGGMLDLSVVFQLYYDDVLSSLLRLVDDDPVYKFCRGLFIEVSCRLWSIINDRLYPADSESAVLKDRYRFNLHCCVIYIFMKDGGGVASGVDKLIPWSEYTKTTFLRASDLSYFDIPSRSVTLHQKLFSTLVSRCASLGFLDEYIAWVATVWPPLTENERRCDE